MPSSPGKHSALLFPGQGSQTAAMRDVVAAERPDLLGLVQETVGCDPFERVEEGTRYAQPALYCASIAAWERAGRPSAAAFAGHSLGELAALAAAGSIDVGDGLALAVRRGELMQEAATLAPPGGMLALLGDSGAARAAAADGVTIANDNAPGQVVVSGPEAALEATAERAAALNLRAMRLPVKGAFHSPAMEPAVAPFRVELEAIELRPPTAPVFSSASARPFADVRLQLSEAIARPVRWRETLIQMRRRGIGRFLEAGPGRVLSGLVRRTLDEVEATTLERAVSRAG